MKKYIALGFLLTALNLFCANYSNVDAVTIKNNAGASVDLAIDINESGFLKSQVESLPHGESYGPIKRSQLVSLSFTVPSSSSPFHQYEIDLTQPNSLVVTIEYSYWKLDYYADIKSVKPPQLPPREARIPQQPNVFVGLYKDSTGPQIQSLLNSGSTINIIATKYPYLLFGLSSEDKVPNDAKILKQNYYTPLKTLLKQDEAALITLEIAYYHLRPIIIVMGRYFIENPDDFETIDRIRNTFLDAEEYIRQSKEAYNSSPFKKQEQEQEQEQAERVMKAYQMNLKLPNAYATLGVNDKTSTADIKKAYLDLSRQYHPDKAGGNNEKFQEISNAWHIIKTLKDIH